MLPRGYQQTLFAKFFSFTIHSFHNTIGVEQKDVAQSQFAFFHDALPFSNKATTVASSRALAARSYLGIRHDQSGSDAFACYVRYYEAEPSRAEIKEVAIAPADGPSGMANLRIGKCLVSIDPGAGSSA